jgi:hypothetical protein
MMKCWVCKRDKKGHDRWNKYCAAWAEHDFSPCKLMVNAYAILDYR